MNSIITFKEIKRFLETATRDQIGYHYMNKNLPRRIIHIYDSRREANIHLDEDGNICHDKIIGKLYFTDDKVSLIPVNRGVALYDEGIKVDINTDINNIDTILSKTYKTFYPIIKATLFDMGSNA